jgi:Ca2+/Na+ antiporter
MMSDGEKLANAFILGAVVMACLVAGLFFIRFWRKTADRLFLMFAIAFWVLAINWSALMFMSEQNELRTALYLLRMLAFVLILIAIFDKNRTTARKL